MYFNTIFLALIYLALFVLGICMIVLTIKALTAIAKIPDKLDEIKEAIRGKLEND